MKSKLSDAAIFLHAQALERDRSDNRKLGQIWLETRLGAAIRANAFQAGWDLGDLSDVDLGGAIRRRLTLILDDLIHVDRPSKTVEKAVAQQASNPVDEVCIALVCNLGVDPNIAADVAALWIRRTTVEDAVTREIWTQGAREPE